MIAIRPKDSFRYGYRISLDRATAMPLKTQLVDEQGSVLEQILFSEIMLPNRIPASAVQPSVPINTFTSGAPLRDGDTPHRPNLRTGVRRETPPGFRLTVRQAKVAPDAGTGLRHLVYSDGLATVSLFIEPAVAASEQAEGLSQIGAANAYTTTVGRPHDHRRRRGSGAHRGDLCRFRATAARSGCETRGAPGLQLTAVRPARLPSLRTHDRGAGAAVPRSRALRSTFSTSMRIRPGASAMACGFRSSVSARRSCPAGHCVSISWLATPAGA